MGGSRGKVLSEMVSNMSEEFHDRWRSLRESKYDPLDYTNDVSLCDIAAVVFNITVLFDEYAPKGSDPQPAVSGIDRHSQIIKNNN